MRIRIKGDGVDVNLVLPTGLLIGKTVIRIANTIGRRYATEALEGIPPETLERLCAELRRVKKKHGSWELVDVESASGEIVKIVL